MKEYKNKGIARGVSLVGNKYNRLTVLSLLGVFKRGGVSASRESKWLCICECGKNKEVFKTELRNGNVASCGCLVKELAQQRRKDITGKTFNQLTVIERAEDYTKHKRTMWKCLCDCGNSKIVATSNLLNGAVKSCGCLQKRRASETFIKPFGYAAQTHFYHTYKDSARKRGFLFDITVEDFRILSESPCNYCGSMGSEYQNTFKTNGKFTGNGVDRIDSNIGYIKGNIVPCCKICNMMKRNIPVEEFIEKCNMISEHFKVKNN